MESGVTGRRISAPGRATASRVAGGPKLTEIAASEAVAAAGSAPHSDNGTLSRDNDRQRREAERYEIAAETRRLLLQTTSPRLSAGRYASADMTRRLGSEAYARQDDPAPAGPTVSKTI